MAEIKPILVNGKKYQVQMMSVLDTIDLQVETMTSLGGLLGKIATAWVDARNNREIDKNILSGLFKDIDVNALRPIKSKVFGQVISPENKFLGDPVELENWFSRPENRQDVWEVLVRATIELLGEYVPSFLKDLMKQGMEKVSANKSKSQKNTESKQSSSSLSNTG